MTLYLKYRATNLEDLDIKSVRESLKKIVSSGKIPHAFLFAGPKGTGKTSAARILAKIINCEDLGKDGKPCEKCDQCKSINKGSNLDVIELDAASHRGIDDVRTLRDAVKLSPTKAKKKIYIIDEAHMLTTEASNALLKTLEEPPEHVVFILATTNPEKLIETIRSRTTYVPFNKATTEEIVRSLKRVVAGEKIKIDDEALGVIARASDGAFRDAIKTLEQLIIEERELSKEFLEEHLFRNKSFDTGRFAELLVAKDVKNLLIEIGKLGPSGVATDIFLEALLLKLRGGLLATAGIGEAKIDGLNQDELIKLIELFTEASKDGGASLIEELPLEIAVIKWCGEEGKQAQPSHSDQNSHSAKSGTGLASSHSRASAESGLSTLDSTSQDLAHTGISRAHEPGLTPEEGTRKVSEAQTVSSALDGLTTDMEEVRENVNEEIWKNILSSVKPVNASIEALLRASRPVAYDGKILTLGVYYKFHKERLEDAHHRTILEDVVGKVLHSPTRVVCTLVDPPPKKVVDEAKVEPVLTEGKDADIIKVAEEIFGN